MNAMIKDTLRRMIVAICIMWLWESRDVENREADWLRFYVYTSDIDFHDERMIGHRIEVNFEIKRTPSDTRGDYRKARGVLKHE